MSQLQGKHKYTTWVKRLTVNLVITGIWRLKVYIAERKASGDTWKPQIKQIETSFNLSFFLLWYNSIQVRKKRNSEIQSNRRAVNNCLFGYNWRYKSYARYSFKKVWKPPHNAVSVCIIHKECFTIKHGHECPSASIQKHNDHLEQEKLPLLVFLLFTWKVCIKISKEYVMTLFVTFVSIYMYVV